MDAVENFLRGSVACFADKDLPGGCLVAVHASDTEMESEIRARLLKISQLTEIAIAERFQAAIDAGEIGRQHSATKLAALMYCVLSGLSHAARTGASRRKLNGIVRSFLATLGNLID